MLLLIELGVIVFEAPNKERDGKSLPRSWVKGRSEGSTAPCLSPESPNSEGKAEALCVSKAEREGMFEVGIEWNEEAFRELSGNEEAEVVVDVAVVVVSSTSSLPSCVFLFLKLVRFFLGKYLQLSAMPCSTHLLHGTS